MTKLSKTGQPVQGTIIEIKLTNGSWEQATVVGKLYGKGGFSDLVGLIVEWNDKVRQRVPYPDLDWRSC